MYYESDYEYELYGDDIDAEELVTQRILRSERKGQRDADWKDMDALERAEYIAHHGGF